MPRFKQLDLSGVRTIPIRRRKSRVTPSQFARVVKSPATFAGFVDSLPDILASAQLRELVSDIVRARKKRKPVILMMGAHIIKVGLSPLVVDLMKAKVITSVAMNSAAAIHDVESAMWGRTSEDVAENLRDGTFGMSKETGDFINNALSVAYFTSDAGYGETLARALLAAKAPNRSVSIIASAFSLGVPVTIHAAIGTDIIHQQPSMDGAATGELSYRDFKVFAASVKDLTGGGVVLNFGSAVIMPEVFLKALTVARNLGYKARGFSTANFDMLRHYRPTQNVVLRPTRDGGKGYDFSGHHEIMFPLLAAMITLETRRRGSSSR